MGSQEVSKPMMVGILAMVAIAIVAIGWWYFGRPQRYPGYQAPQGGYGRPSGMVPGMGMEMQRPTPPGTAAGGPR